MNTIQPNNELDDLKKEIKKARENIDEYEGTIHAIWSFLSLTTWDNKNKVEKTNSKYSLGRQMTTSKHNLVSKQIAITPDLVSQVGQELGYIVEAKYSMPLDQTHWDDDAKQLIKYDDDLTGWWTEEEKLDSHNIVLLIEYARSTDVRDFIEQWLKINNLTYKRNFAIVEFTKSDNANHYYAFKKIWGNIEDEDLSTRLYKSVKVPLDAVVSTYGSKKFYDAQPPIIEYTMVVLWLHVFPQRRVGIDFNKKLGGHPIYINLDEFTEEVQRLYGQLIEDERSVAFPKIDWIKNTLDELEKMKLARKLDKTIDGYDYLILHKDLHVNDILEYFISHRKKRSTKKGKQLRLL